MEINELLQIFFNFQETFYARAIINARYLKLINNLWNSAIQSEEIIFISRE